MATPTTPPAPSGLTLRQQKWMDSVRRSLERDTGRSVEDWVAITRTCPETRPPARAAWLKANYGLARNHAAQVLYAAFLAGEGWDEPETLKAKRERP